MVDVHILGEYLFSGASRDGHSQMNLIPVAKAAQNLQQRLLSAGSIHFQEREKYLFHSTSYLNN